jgi:hypothetical protein
MEKQMLPQVTSTGSSGGGGASREELLALIAARDAGHAASLAARDAGHAAALAARDAALAAVGAERDAAVAAHAAALAAARASAAERDADRAFARTMLARDATLASALGERDALRRRLALPNVRVALRGEDFLDVIGIVSSVGFAAEVSQCAQLCRLTRDIVQRGDVADMLAQSLRLQCGAREARAAGREEFLDHDGDVLEATTQLIRAATLNNLPRVLQLIQIGAPLDLVDKSWDFSALHEACYWGHEHVAKALLDGKYEGRGAKIDLRDGSGRTPLFAATGRGQDAIVRLLLSRGARQELQDSHSGYTALHWAVHCDDSSILALLCAAPGAAAALALKSYRGTPLALAIRRGHGACEAVLRAQGAPE